MKNEEKTKAQLLEEIKEMRMRIVALEKAEALVKQTEEKYRTILDEMEDGYQEVDLAGNFTFFNESFLKIFGYTDKEMMGTNYRLYAADAAIAQKVYRAYNQMYKTGVPIRKFDWNIIRKDGSRRTVEFFASLLRNADGHPAGFRGIVRDVTDHMQAYKALRQSEERYRGLFEHAVEGIYQSTLEGRFIDVNPAMAHMCGYESPEDMIKSITDISTQHYVDPLDRETYKSLLDANGRIDNIGYRVQHRDGSAIWVSGSARVVRNDQGDTLYYEGRCQDITARKQAEEERKKLESQLKQAQKMESIGTLAGGIAHDFNNLLMGIQGYASLMLMALDAGHPHYEKLRAIEEQVQSGADLTRQLLGFARGGRYEVKPTDLNDLIRKTAAMFGRTKKEIRIHEKYGEGLRAVDADRGQMDQVLLNLFVNAWQAMPGGGDLFLETDNVDLDAAYVAPYAIKPGPYVKICITDTGVGMDEKTKQRIFDPFFTTREMGRGTGLGLASAYGIIKGHGGFINVYSEKGHGTTFNIYLPASDRATVRETPVAEAIHRGHETIFLVDDERMILDVTQEMLAGLGYRVLVAPGGAEALEVYRAQHETIDLVILDMIMPGIGGGEVLDGMKAVNPGVRIILSSGYSLNGMARNIMERGARLFLQKPFRLDNLSRKIREALGSVTE